MKSPGDLRRQLIRNWENADFREAKLHDAASQWPIALTIGYPTSQQLQNELDRVREHVQSWREVIHGVVQWQPVRYRATGSEVEVPVRWLLRKPTEWITATKDSRVQAEFRQLSNLIERVDSLYHTLLIRRRVLWRGRDLDEVVHASCLALKLTPGIARGLPLRALAFEGIDTKFFERNRTLITAFLDQRFEGEVSHVGLEAFLNAQREGEHWLLVVDLDGTLMAFQKTRVRSSELQQRGLPAAKLLIIENESCQAHLPRLPGVLAVLGTGFDLSWLEGNWLKGRCIGYWGDIDTWGLQFLAKARRLIPALEALMMTVEVFEQFRAAAVVEPIPAEQEPPQGLLPAERELYLQLLREPRGRLEQEFITAEVSNDSLMRFAASENP
jgi:hypothetical protein